MWGKNIRWLDVRPDHFFAPHFLPFLNFGCGSRPPQVLSALCVSILSLNGSLAARFMRSLAAGQEYFFVPHFFVLLSVLVADGRPKFSALSAFPFVQSMKL